MVRYRQTTVGNGTSQVEIKAGPRNHLNLQSQVAQLSRLHRAAVLRWGIEIGIWCVLGPRFDRSAR